jgi:uncharacterized protein
MNESSTIPKEISGEYGKDFAFLREEGLRYIEELAHTLWTDYNTHDPGVTMLEVLCYAITDLGYRIAMPVEEILAKPKENLKEMHSHFLSAIHALPSSPVSADDYRQLFVRVDGVRNAWIRASDRRIAAQFRNLAQPGKAELHYVTSGEIVDPQKFREFKLQGLNKILLDYDESSFLTDEDKTRDEATQKQLIVKKKKKIARRVLEIYQRYRNLCEDIDTLHEVPLEGVVICGDIDIEPTADPEQVWAEIVFNINHYLAPDVPFYTLQEMQEMGKSTDEIFEGPVFSFDDTYTYKTHENPFTKKGFICREDLVKSELRTEVRLSDIIRIIMETDGVKLVKEIAFGLCGCDEKEMDKVRMAVTGDKWNLCITPGCKPVFCLDNSVLNLWKGVMPIELKMTEAKDKLGYLREKRNKEMQAKLTEDIPMPEGVFREISDYQSFQNHFPETYGIGRAGLPESASIQRKSQAKQLKAYLLFFEQVLANYFAQLANVSVLFSADNTIARTYFANVVQGIAREENIFNDFDHWQQDVETLLKSNGLDPYITRKNMFLDHLLARFSEHFSDYVFLMHRLYAEDADRTIIRHKVDFLKDYDNMSTSRGSGFDYYNPRSATAMLANVPGMEKRASRLLGFNHYNRHHLSGQSYQVVETSKMTMTVNGVSRQVQRYGWIIRMGGVILFESVNKAFLKKADAYEELGLASLLGCERDYYKPVLTPDHKRVSFSLLDTKEQVIALNHKKYPVLAGEIDTGTYSLLENKIEEIIHYLLEEFRLEGMYVVEHLLLRPDFTISKSKSQLFFPVCIEPEGSYCPPPDPYSFRVTVVLPGYSMRLRNKQFRQFAERLIRMESPAHVLPRICFVNEEYMKKFEEAYSKWLKERHHSPNPLRQASDAVLTELIMVIEEMFTVYEEGRLTDCDDDTPDKNPVVLGSSRLGSLESDSKPG